MVGTVRNTMPSRVYGDEVSIARVIRPNIGR